MARVCRQSMVLALCAIAAALAVAEAAARLATRIDPENGMPALAGVPLLPYRPDLPAVQSWVDRVGHSTYIALDPELGWTVLRGGYTVDRKYEANAQGARAARSRIYAPVPPQGTVRAVTVGDSFTHGDGVSNSETWQARLEGTRDDLEVINLGVGGYGTDQALLRWRRDGRSFAPHFAILGVWPENMCRNLNVIRYFLAPTGGYASKPRFMLESGTLRLSGTPVLRDAQLVGAVTAPERSEALRGDYWVNLDEVQDKWWYGLRIARAVASAHVLYRRHETRNRLYSGDDASGIDLTVAIAAAFSEEVSRAGATPLILVMPMRELLESYSINGALPLTRALRTRGLEVLDFGPAFARAVREQGQAWCFQRDGHLTAACNRFLADRLIEQLGPRIELRKGAAGAPTAAQARPIGAVARPLRSSLGDSIRDRWRLT